jgi:hypothetical protein
MATARPQMEETHLKAALTAAREKHRGTTRRQADAAVLAQQLNYRRAVELELKPLLTKAGLDVQKLDKMAAQNQSELRRTLANNKAEAARRGSLEMAAIRKEVQQRARALQNPANLLVLPFTAINLDPIFIWQTNVGSFKGSQIAPGDSWVKFLMEATSGSFSTNYSFVFYWQNQRNDLAVVNVASSLVLNGLCEAFAATGFFSGDICYVDMEASLTLLGLWQADPQNPELPPPTPAWQQSQYQPVTNLQAQGGGLFGSVGVQSQTFSASSYGLSYDFFLIPPQSSAAFEVSLDVGIGFQSGGGNISDLVEADFADDKYGYELMCPGLELDLLTAPQAVS